jgi:hypothetical protein
MSKKPKARKLIKKRAEFHLSAVLGGNISKLISRPLHLKNLKPKMTTSSHFRRVSSDLGQQQSISNSSAIKRVEFAQHQQKRHPQDSS